MVGTRIYTLRGVRLHCGPDDVPRSVQSMIFKGTYEAAEADLVDEVVRPGTRVVEFGTGIGFISLLCRRLAGDGNVRSFEANPAMEPVIRANYALNGMEPDLVMKAVTPDGAPLTFYRDDNILSSSGFDRQRDAEAIKIESERIDRVVADFRPDVIVMDIEGAEVAVLTGADLSRVRALVIETHPHIVGEEATASLIEDLASQGFSQAAQRHKNVLMVRTDA